MNGKLVATLAIVGALSVAGVIYFSLNQKQGVDTEFVTVDSLSVRYVEYSSSSLSNNAEQQRVLFFYANWCPTCRPADEELKSRTSEIPSDVTVIRVNYADSDTDQDEKDLAKKYGVAYQHTYVLIDEIGNEVKKWNGGSVDELIEQVR